MFKKYKKRYTIPLGIFAFIFVLGVFGAIAGGAPEELEKQKVQTKLETAQLKAETQEAKAKEEKAKAELAEQEEAKKAKEAEEKAKAEEERLAKEKAEADKKAKEDEEAKKKAEAEKNAEIDSLEDSYLAILNESFDTGTFTLDKEKKIFLFSPGNELSQSILALAMGNLSTSIWKESVNKNFLKMSKQIKDGLGEGYILAIQNPSNKDKNIWFAQDGILFYDFADEL